MKIIDITGSVEELYANGRFDLELWKRFMRRTMPGLELVCVDDLNESLECAGLSWEDDYLPVLNGLVKRPDLIETARRSFARVTDGLENKINARFAKIPDAEIILYPGLCSGAGWVTEAEGKTVVLCGIEKIVELGWCGVDDMYGLVFHELGHVYQKQFGVLDRKFDRQEREFMWQLFTEGVAMVFEQEVVGDERYYHQDKNGWKQWCGANLKKIAADFKRDACKMTKSDQRYFGDWASYEGRPDVGYYLGAVFVRFIMQSCDFDDLISWDIDKAEKSYEEFLLSIKKNDKENVI